MQLRIRFVWNRQAHDTRRARDLKGLVRLTKEMSMAGNFRTYWVDARLLLKLGVAILVIGWLAGASGLYFWLARNPFNRVGFVDLAAPWRWTQLRELRGQAYLDEGLDACRAQRFETGVPLLKQGLARYPNSARARLMLAELYVRSGLYAMARETLLPQLDYEAPPRAYVKFLIEAARQYDDHATILTACDRLLAHRAVPEEDRGGLLEQKAAALTALGRPTEALAALEAAGRERSLEWRRLQIGALVALGRGSEAVAAIGQWSAGLAEIFRWEMLALVYRESGPKDALTETVNALLRAQPLDPRRWAQGIGHYAHAGLRDAAWTLLQAGVQRFAGDEKAMGVLQRECVEAGLPELMTVIVENARDHGHSVVRPLYDLTVAHLRTGDTASAERSLAQMSAEEATLRARADASRPPTPAAQNPMAEGTSPARRSHASLHAPSLPPPLNVWLRALVAQTTRPEDDRATELCTALEGGKLVLSFFTLSAEILAKAGQWPAVETVAQLGLRRYPGSTQLTRWSEAARPKVAARPAKTAVVIRTVVAAPPASAPQPIQPAQRPPPRTEPPTAPGVNYATMPQADFFLKLDAAAQQGAWSEADAMITAVTSAAPGWLSGVEGELEWRRVRGALETGDLPRATLRTALRLRTKPVEAIRPLAMAREWLGRGEAELAEKLTATIVAAVPQFKPGQVFLDELRAKHPTKTTTEKDPSGRGEPPLDEHP